MDKDTFFAFARRAPFGGRLTQQQVDGTNALFDAWDQDGDSDVRKLANVLAQVFHETGGRMVPVRETFAASDATVIRRLDRAWANGEMPQVKTAYWRAGWFGRGPIQVTHEANYVRMGQALGVDLRANPGLLLQQPWGARSAVVGMMQGLFTGKKLADYFNGNTNDPVGARRIVNGTDKASLIAGYHASFLDSLKAAQNGGVETIKTPAAIPTALPVAEVAKPDGPPLRKDRTTIGGALQAVGGIGGIAAAAPLLSAINTPWAFAALALFAAIICVGAYLTLTGRIDLKRIAGA